MRFTHMVAGMSYSMGYQLPTSVPITTNRSNREIYDELKTHGADNVNVVGDARSPPYTKVAIREEYLAGAAA